MDMEFIPGRIWIQIASSAALAETEKETKNGGGILWYLVFIILCSDTRCEWEIII